MILVLMICVVVGLCVITKPKDKKEIGRTMPLDEKEMYN